MKEGARETLTKEQLRERVEMDGLCGLFKYFGPNLPTHSKKIRDQWVVAYYAMQRLEESLDIGN